MANGVNKVILIGNLGKDPESQTFDSGVKKTSFSLATTEEYKDKEGNKKFVYMLNNTALPSPRIFISILENYQQADGSMKIPTALQKYMPGNMKVIK